MKTRKTAKKAVRLQKKRTVPQRRGKPDVSQTMTSYLIVGDAAAAIAFYKAAFGAHLLFQLSGADGQIHHAELQVGSSRLMLADEDLKRGPFGPATIGGSPVFFHLAVDDPDRAVAVAVKAGAHVTRPVAEQFYGERSGMVADPFGYQWVLATTIETLSPREVERRWKKLAAGN